MKLTACLLVLSSALYCTANAQQPPSTAPTTAAAPAPAAAVAVEKPPVVAAAAAPAKIDKSPAVDVAETDALIKKMRARGYKPVNRKGTLVFCRSEGELGTHFERTRCNTLDELKDAERTGQEYTNQIQQQGSPTPFKGDMPANAHP